MSHIKEISDLIEHLVCCSEIAERFEVARPAVSNWRARYRDFPKPIKTLAIGDIWDIREVEHWAKRHNLPKPPPAKLSRDEKTIVIWRAKNGESIEDLAAEYGITVPALTSLVQ